MKKERDTRGWWMMLFGFIILFGGAYLYGLFHEEEVTITGNIVNCGCISVHLDDYVGRYASYDNGFPYKVKERGFAVPMGSTVKVYENMSVDGNPQNELFRFGLGQC